MSSIPNVNLTYLELKIHLEFNFKMFSANYRELMGKIHDYKNPEVYSKLVKLDPSYTELDNYVIDVSRLLINYVSLSCGMKDSCRNLIQKHYKQSSFIEDYDQKIGSFFTKCELVAFIEVFRNYVLHYRLPIVNAKLLSYPSGSYSDLGFILSKSKLLSYDWNNTKKGKIAKEFLDKQESSIDIEDIIYKYYKITKDFYTWLLSALPPY